MKFHLDIQPTARQDLADTVRYYEDLREGLGLRFLDLWEKQVEALCSNALLYQKKHKSFRTVLIKPYPYHIVYEIEGQTVYVYKVVFAGRHPKKRYTKK